MVLISLCTTLGLSLLVRLTPSAYHHSTLVFVVAVALLLAFSALVLVGHVRAVEAENELLRQQPFLDTSTTATATAVAEALRESRFTRVSVL